MTKRSDESSSEGPARASNIRSERIEELLREELNSLLESEISDPCLQGIRVTSVELSRDGARARVWFAVVRDDGTSVLREVLAAFARASGFLRSRLCDALALKRMPELRFRHDPAAVVDPTVSDEKN